jgi:hypothetical protein
MVGIGACVSVAGCDNSWSAVVGHVLGFHWEQGQGRIFDTKCPREVEVGCEEGVKAEISAKAQPIVCIGDVVIIPVDNVNIPSHQLHLQEKNGMVCSVV